MDEPRATPRKADASPRFSPRHTVKPFTKSSDNSVSRLGSRTRPSTTSTAALDTRAEETQDEFRAAAQATAYYEKIYAKFEEQEDENSAKYPSGFSQEAIGLLTPEPADRDIIQLKKVFKELRTTTFFQALPDERQDTSYWLNILKKAILRPDLQAETVLYVDSHDSPCRTTAGKGRKDKNKGDIGMSTLFIVLAGGVQVIRDSSDSGSLLSSGDAFGAGALDRLTDPKSAVVFCNDTCLLEISADIMTRAHAIKMNDYLRFLKSTRLFANTPEEQLAQIVPLFQLRKYWSNEVIVKQGEISSELFIIASGCVRVVQEVVVPYNMPRNGYITTPSEIMEPVSSAAVATLAHVKQARFSVKSCARDTAKSAGMILGGQMAKVLTSMEQADINLLETRREILSARGTFVSTIARLEEQKFKPTSQEKPAFNGAAALSALHTLNTMGFNPLSRPGIQQKKSTAPGTRALVVELRQLWKGSYFGELSLINKAPKTASVIAKTPVMVFALGKIDFYRYFDEKFFQWLRHLAQENDYHVGESSIAESLRWESEWVQYRQNISSDTVFKASSTALLTAQRQNSNLVDAVLEDPANLAAVTPRQVGPSVTSQQIMRLNVHETYRTKKEREKERERERQRLRREHETHAWLELRDLNKLGLTSLTRLERKCKAS